jgi:hypothetical protein
MRKTATVKRAGIDIVRVMLYDSGSGVYLFLYESYDDGPCTADYWFESIELAEQAATADYGVAASDWQSIPDPPAGCREDWIAPTRL